MNALNNGDPPPTGCPLSKSPQKSLPSFTKGAAIDLTGLATGVALTLVHQTFVVRWPTIARSQIRSAGLAVRGIQVDRRRWRRCRWRRRRPAVKRRCSRQGGPGAGIPGRLVDVFFAVPAIAPPLAIGNGSTRILRVGGVVALHGRRGGLRFGQAVGLQLREDRFLDRGVARVSRVEGPEPPPVLRLVAASTTAPRSHPAAVESGLCLLSGHVPAGGGCTWGPLAGDLPGIVQVPEVDLVKMGIGVDLLLVVGARLAEAVACKMRIDIDVADFRFVFVGFGSAFVELVDCRHTIVEGLSERFAKVWIDVGRVDSWDTPILRVAPRIIIGAEELRITG